MENAGAQHYTQILHNYEQLLDIIPDLVLVFDRRGTFVSYRAGEPSAMVTPPTYILGRTVEEVFPPPVARLYRQGIEATLATGCSQRWTYEAPVPLPDGEPHHFEARTAPKDENHVVVILQNLERSWHAVNEQLAWHYGLRGLLAAVNSLMTVDDAATFWRRAGELAREKLGLERTFVYAFQNDAQTPREPWVVYGTDARGVTTVEPADNLHALGEDFLQRLLSAAEPLAPETQENVPLYTWDGRQRTLLCHGWRWVAPVYAHNRLAAVFCNDTAITRNPPDSIRQELAQLYCSLLGAIYQRLAAEQALAASEQRYRELYTHTQSTLKRTQALYDASRAIISSQRVEEILQAFADSAAVALGADFVRVNIVDMEKRQLRYLVWDTINPKQGTPDSQSFADLWEGLAGWVLRTGKPVLSPPGVVDPRESPAVRQRRLAFTGPQGGCVLVVPMRYAGRMLGTVTAVNHDGNRIFTAEDMDMLMALANQAGVVLENARLRAESEARAADLAVQAQALARSNADLEQFAYVASHDLQEPLRVVSSFLQLFMRRHGDQVPEEGLFFLEQAVDGAQRMQQLIQDLLAYSRVQTRAQERRPVPSEEVLAYTLLGLEHAIAEANAEITSDALPVVLVDETQFGQLLQNLLSNALKFRGETPTRIHIHAQALEDEDMWLFAVQDNGIGIPREHQERIFQMFQRLHTREEYPGTGLGLALCKKIVERHGGRIWVESEPGQGATFYFTLPRVKEGEPSAQNVIT